MHRLVALDLPGGPAFVAALRRCWDHGDAVVVLDQRLPATARARLLDLVRPHLIISGGPQGDAVSDGTTFDANAPLMDDGDRLVVTTSGSTGEPKVLVHTDASLVAHARAVHQHLAVDPRVDRWLACLPLNHLGGFGVVARSILTDVPVEVANGFDAETVRRSAAERSATLVSLVPTALDRVDASAFRWVVLGGSSDAVIRPGNVVHTYGLTETGGGIVYEGVAIEGVAVRIAHDGAISVQTPTLARGLRRPDGEIVALPGLGRDGWFATADLGAWDTNGRLVVHGRADDLIITGAENVWPEPVEAALRTHPGVADALVAGVADPEWGQRVVASIVPVSAFSPPTLEELREHVRQTLPTYAAPRELRLVDTVERTPLGKVRRR